VLNAGVLADAAFPGLSGDAWDRVLRTNLDGFYNVLRPLVMPMIRLRDGGRIATLSSLAGIAGNRGQVNYAASKAGIIGATKSLAHELAKRDITVNCVAPGWIETEMLEGADLEALAAAVPLRRLGTPDDVAAAVSFLFSDGASYITGQVLSVNGGLL
jgi:3-oxoacyl-[acyl-carrier protein] reductase